MQFINSVDALKEALNLLRRKSGKIGFVPTMGALHEGHLSLVSRSRKEMDATVVSLFVNPTQFGPSEDFNKYPRPVERDRALCEKAGVDLLFSPSPAEMYPAGYGTYVLQERYTEAFEGAVRTGHFHGVCTVCAKLFNLLRPAVAYFGQKDYQQTVVIRRMVKDLNMELDIRVCPIVREADGLAMSSRNIYLSPEERLQAATLQRALAGAERAFASGERSAAPLLNEVRKILREAPLAQLDYAAVVDPNNLQELRRIETGAVVLLAARFGKTRLIDNTLLSPE